MPSNESIQRQLRKDEAQFTKLLSIYESEDKHGNKQYNVLELAYDLFDLLKGNTKLYKRLAKKAGII